MKKIKDLFINFLATVIVMIGSTLMNYFVTHEISFVTVIYGVISLLLLWGAINYWDQKLKSFLEDEKPKNNN